MEMGRRQLQLRIAVGKQFPWWDKDINLRVKVTTICITISVNLVESSTNLPLKWYYVEVPLVEDVEAQGCQVPYGKNRNLWTWQLSVSVDLDV